MYTPQSARMGRRRDGDTAGRDRTGTLHHLPFENAVVKVLDVQVPAGATMAVHTHPNDHLAILLRGAKLRNEVEGEPPVDRYIGDPGTVIFLPTGPPHRQISLDDQAARWIAVELMGAAKPGRTEPVGPHYEDVLDNARVQVARPACTG